MPGIAVAAVHLVPAVAARCVAARVRRMARMTAVMRLVALVRPGRGWVIGVSVAGCLLVAGHHCLQVDVIVQVYTPTEWTL